MWIASIENALYLALAISFFAHMVRIARSEE
jgi:hypothetical protein